MLFVWTPLLLLLFADADVRTVEQLLARGDYRGALEQLKTVNRDAQWHFLASRAWDGLNEPAKAVAEAEEALKLDVARPQYHLHLAQIFLSRNTPRAALEILTEAEGLFPGAYVIRLGKGIAQKELQLYEEAERTLKSCLAEQPGSALAFDALATIYIHLSRFSDARRLSGEFLKYNAADYRGYYFLAAAMDGELAPSEETLRFLAESKQRNPSFAAAHALTGKILLREKQAQAAVPHLKKAVELRPDLVQAHLHLGRAFRLLGRETAAAQEFEIVRKLKQKEQEGVPALLYHRGSR
jgi:tetratricopeptide (TPR) repeat protein